jgi:hypothetical protein
LALGTGLAGGREDLGRPVDIAPATPVSLNEINDLPTELLSDPIDLYNVSFITIE